MRFQRDSRDGTAFLRILDGKLNVSAGYYSNRKWLDDDRLVLSASEGIDDKGFQPCRLFLADLKGETSEEIASDCAGFSEYVVHEDQLYYINSQSELWEIDLASGRRSFILKDEGMNFPHQTRDGRFINWAKYTDKGAEGKRVDLETGEVVTMMTKVFAPPFTVANHMMINPVDPDVLFFAHEGITFYVSNRLWVVKNGEMHRLAKQEMTDEGDLADCLGHEDWSPDGKGLWFVKYPCSPEPPRGLCYVDLETGEWQVRYSAFNYWHAAASSTGKYVAADTQDKGWSGVCLVDTETGEEKMLLKAGTKWVHPAHPHPMFSPHDKRLSFHDLDERGMITVGIIDIE